MTAQLSNIEGWLCDNTAIPHGRVAPFPFTLQPAFSFTLRPAFSFTLLPLYVGMCKKYWGTCLFLYAPALSFTLRPFPLRFSFTLRRNQGNYRWRSQRHPQNAISPGEVPFPELVC